MFLSYAKEDRERAKSVAEALEECGWSVWWDRKIPPGRTFDEVIDEQMKNAKCVVVLWSQASVKSNWVREEADEGFRRRILVPALINDIELPRGFKRIQAAKLTDWQKGTSHSEFDSLVTSITGIVGGRVKPVPLPPQDDSPSPGDPEGTSITTEPTRDSGKQTRGLESAESKDCKVTYRWLWATLIALATILITILIYLRVTEVEPLPSMVKIPAGNFSMGSNSGPDDEKPMHLVTITEPFYLSATEITQGQWRSVMRHNPSNFSRCGDGCPVEKVNWYEAIAFCNALSEREGYEECYDINGCIGKPGEGMKCSEAALLPFDCKGYRLPTEAEWEYAARAGTKTYYYTGDDESDLSHTAWYDINSNEQTHPVGEKEPNAFGLHGMLGNVREWIEDDYHGSYQGAPADGRAWMKEPRGTSRVVRGGSWYWQARLLVVSIRDQLGSTHRYNTIGFRCAQDCK
ncbi:SUMF1/EgtB/PvdO family nonheme iron enzyme [Thermodesulfobacteriota bacterium]